MTAVVCQMPRTLFRSMSLTWFVLYSSSGLHGPMRRRALLSLDITFIRQHSRTRSIFPIASQARRSSDECSTGLLSFHESLASHPPDSDCCIHTTISEHACDSTVTIECEAGPQDLHVSPSPHLSNDGCIKNSRVDLQGYSGTSQ